MHKFSKGQEATSKSWTPEYLHERVFLVNIDISAVIFAGAFCSVRLDWYIFFCVKKCNDCTKQMYVNIQNLLARATRLWGFLYNPLGLEVYGTSSNAALSMCFCHPFTWERGTNLSMELNVGYWIAFYFKHGRWKIPRKEWSQMWSVYAIVRVSHNLLCSWWFWLLQ